MRAGKGHSSQILAMILSLILAAGSLIMPVFGEQTTQNAEESIAVEAGNESEDEAAEAGASEDVEDVSENKKESAEESTEEENKANEGAESSDFSEDEGLNQSSGDTVEQPADDSNDNEGVSNDNTVEADSSEQSAADSDTDAVLEDNLDEANDEQDTQNQSSEEISEEPAEGAVSTEAQYEDAGDLDPISIEDAEVTGITDKIYDGSEQTQTLVVKYGDETLVEDQDYEVSYYNNIEVGTATVIITGIGSYTGTIEKPFSIKRVGWYRVLDEDWNEYYWHYADENGKDVTGWKLIGGKWYYFYNSGVMATGTEYIDGSYYLFTDSGAMFTGWHKDSYGYWYYYLDSGKQASGWQKIGGKWYYFDDYMYSGDEYQIDGAYYRFSGSGAMFTGWYKNSEGEWYYYLSSGKRASGWAKIDGKWYYFEDWCGMVTGEHYIDVSYYRFSGSGAMFTGWYKKSYTNWYEWYYYLPSGKRVIGWAKINDKWYYFREWSGMVTGGHSIDGSNYRFSDSGAMITGWYKESYSDWSLWYYYLSSGKEARGWQKICGKWYYFDPEMVSDRVEIIGGKGYKFAKSGYLMYANTTGWVKIYDGNGNLDYAYYVSSGGALAVGWKKIGGKWYYFDTYNCEMQNDEWPETINNKGYFFRSNGVMQGEAGGWIKRDDYYWYYANKGGSLVTGWKKINGKWYYFDADGGYYMYRGGTYKINQRSYTFDDNGVCKNK